MSSDKCVYTLPPFDPCFDPLVHNKYMRAMEQRRLLKEGKKTEGQSFKTKEKQTRNIRRTHHNNLLVWEGRKKLR